MINCKRCDKNHDGTFGSGKYCSRSCSNSRTINRVEINEKISRKMKQQERTDWSSRMKNAWANIDKKKHGEKISAYYSNRLNDISYLEYKLEESSKGTNSARTVIRYAKLLGLVENVCYKCKIGEEWQDEYLCLQIDHIDGDTTNNKLSNLRIACPNCHTQTKTWGFKGARSRKE